jgi:hypothetical protein
VETTAVPCQGEGGAEDVLSPPKLVLLEYLGAYERCLLLGERRAVHRMTPYFHMTENIFKE